MATLTPAAAFDADAAFAPTWDPAMVDVAQDAHAPMPSTSPVPSPVPIPLAPWTGTGWTGGPGTAVLEPAERAFLSILRDEDEDDDYEDDDVFFEEDDEEDEFIDDEFFDDEDDLNEDDDEDDEDEDL